MHWIQRLSRRVRILLTRSRVEREMDEEMRVHIEMEIEDLMRRGMGREEARREALLRFGGVERYKEEGRDARGVRWLVDMSQDFRYALRTLRKNPGYTFVAALTLALGIGATTAIFSVVDGVLLKPLPYPEPERLVRVFEQSSPSYRWLLSVVDYQAIEEQQVSFDALAGLYGGEATLTGGDQPERVRVGYVTADWFNTLGLQPAEGRSFRSGEDRPGSERVVVVAHAFRERHFGSAAPAVGQAVVLNGETYAVVGVLPRGVESLAGWRADIWAALQLRPPTRRGPFFIQAVARLSGGISVDEAALDLARISDRIFPVWAESFQDEDARLTPVPLRDVMVGDIGRALVLLLGAVGFVLLIAVANVANLQLARASTREREIALRTSLGATGGRLARQLTVESTTLAVLGGLVGLLLAFLALDALVSFGPRLPRLDEVQLDGRVLGFAAVVTIASGLLFGLVPLIQGLSPDLSAALRSGGRTESAGKRSGVLRGALVTAEFALALPLVAGAALLFGSLGRLQQVDAGFDPDNLMLATVTPSVIAHRDGESLTRFWDLALPSIGEIPGVEGVGISSGLPPDDPRMTNNFDLVGQTRSSGPPPAGGALAVGHARPLRRPGRPLAQRAADGRHRHAGGSAHRDRERPLGQPVLPGRGGPGQADVHGGRPDESDDGCRRGR